MNVTGDKLSGFEDFAYKKIRANNPWKIALMLTISVKKKL